MSRNSRISHIYTSMKQRCNNTKDKHYKYYGARGITVCPEWLDSERINTGGHNNPTKGFKAFKKWAIENGYSAESTLDRIDVNGNYEPSNCRWVTMKEQANNKRNNNYVTYKGKTQTLKQWCEELKLGYHKTYLRLRRGKTIEEAFEGK